MIQTVRLLVLNLATQLCPHLQDTLIYNLGRIAKSKVKTRGVVESDILSITIKFCKLKQTQSSTITSKESKLTSNSVSALLV